MAINVTNFDSAGIAEAWYSFKDASNIYAIGDALTLAAGSSAGCGKLELIETFALSPQAPRIVTTTGNDGPGHTFIFPPTENPSGTVTLGAFNGSFYALQQGMNVYDDGDYYVTAIQPDDAELKNMVLILNSQAKSWDSSSDGAPGYMVTIYCDTNIYPQDSAQLSNAAPTQFQHVAIANKNGYWPTGRAFSASNEGTDKAVGVRFYSPYKVTVHAFTTNGALTTFSLDKTPAADSAGAVRVFNSGAEMTWTSSTTLSTDSFNVTTKVITLGHAITTGQHVVVLYQYSD
jgi:hypothetical protein